MGKEEDEELVVEDVEEEEVAEDMAEKKKFTSGYHVREIERRK